MPKRYIHIPERDLKRIAERLDAGMPKVERKTWLRTFLEVVLEPSGNPKEVIIRWVLTVIMLILSILQVVHWL